MAEQFIAVGDIHGCLDDLDDMPALTRKNTRHKYVLLGDNID